MSLYQPSAATVGSWWGYAKGDPIVIGVLVVIICAVAIAYIAIRAARGRSSAPRERSAETGSGRRRGRRGTRNGR